MKGCSFLAQQCTALVKISLGGGISQESPVTDASVESIAQYCRQLVEIDLDDTGVTDTGAQLLAGSCHKLQYVHVGGTYVTDVGAEALAERCSLAQASAGAHVERRFNLQFGLYNLCLYRLQVDLDLFSLEARFPDISVFGEGHW